MLGIILLLGIIVCGYINLSPWVLAPFTVAAAFVGLHHPSGKAQAAKERGIYWKSLLYSIPLQCALMAILFGFGWGAHALFS